MCGIAGIFGHSELNRIKAMTEALQTRGPDDSGHFLHQQGQLALGHRRLSIIDLTQRGHQPMADATGRFWICYNGEVYNFQALRIELERLGCRHHSDSDTEVVLNAYITWGSSALARLRGMFAFAIYDRQDRRLFLARDRFGIKPLLYAQVSNGLVFASELKALLASGLVSRRADLQAVTDFLSLGAVPQPATIVRGVLGLPAGHWMKVEANGSRRLQRYWDLVENSQRLGSLACLPRNEAVERVRCLLNESTRLHAIADVPVGVFLSGGIDSTAVAGLMAQNAVQKVRSFTVGFESQHHDLSELRWAQLASRKLGTDHHEVVVTGAEVRERWEDILIALDQPSVDGTNSYFVSRAAREAVTVTLSGLGGDELFAGYPHFPRCKLLARRWDWMPLPLARLLSRLVSTRLIPEKGLVDARGERRWLRIRSYFSEADKRRFCTPDLRAQLSAERVFVPLLRPELSVLQECSYVDCSNFMRDTLLRDLDAMSMRFSLEVRPVLLDHELAEFVFRLPDSLKLAPRVNKPLLVDAVRDLIPSEIVHRPKMGFEMPLFDWLVGSLRDVAEAAFQSRSAERVFHIDYRRLALQTLREGRPRRRALWGQVVLLNWLESQRLEVG